MKLLIQVRNYNALLTQTGIQKVMALFFHFPEKEFSLSDVAKETGVAKANLGAIIDKFTKSGFLTIEKLSKIWRIRANKENSYFIRNKLVYNLNFIYQSGLVDLLYKNYNHPKSIVLFGSFRKGEDISTSDIDIAIENDDFKEYKTINLKELSGYEKQIGRRIQIHEFNKKTVDLNLFNNISNGIVLIGFLEVSK